MKRFIQFVSIVIVLALLLAVPIHASEASTPRASHYIMRTCVYLYQNTDTEFEVWYEVVALNLMLEVGAYSIRIQESTDGQNWTTVKTFYASDTPSMVRENAWSHTGYVTYNGIPGRYYRARIPLFAGNSSGEGHVTDTTETIRL